MPTGTGGPPAPDTRSTAGSREKPRSPALDNAAGRSDDAPHVEGWAGGACVRRCARCRRGLRGEEAREPDRRAHGNHTAARRGRASRSGRSTHDPRPKDERVRGDVTIGRIQLDGPVPEAELVIASFRADFSKCYEAELVKNDPTAVGRTEIVMTVEPTGSVVSVTSRGGGLPPPLVECVVKPLKVARFTGWGGRRATIRIPLVFSLARGDGGTK